MNNDNTLIQSAYFVSGKDDFDTHYHNCHEIIFVKHGRVYVNCEGHEYVVTDNQLCFICNLEHHSIKALSDRYERYCMQISPATARHIIKNNTIFSILSNRPEGFCHVVNVEPIANDIESIFRDLVSECNRKDDFSNDAQKSLLRILLIKLYRFSPMSFPLKITVKNNIVEQIQKEFENNYGADYSLESLAKRYHVSKSYLSHLFKEVTGYGVMQYLSDHRLAIAKDLLCTTNMSALRIAEETGFSSGGNFSRFLKNDTGMTPREYRNVYKKGKR